MIRIPLPRVVAVRHIRDNVLWIRFSDGAEGTVDLAGDLRGVLFEPLRDAIAFRSVRIEDGTLVWSNGADWAPETLYDRVVAASGFQRQSIGDGESAEATHLSGVPERSRFYGLVIRMFATDHVPPHFHAYYGEYEVTVSIRDGVVTGQFPARALRLLLEWRDLHEEELIANWDRLRDGGLPIPIAPLA